MEKLEKLMPELSWRIDLGHVLTIVIVVVSVAIAWGVVTAKIDYNSLALSRIENHVDRLDDRLSSVREKQVEMDARLKNVEGQLIDHMRRNPGR